MGVYQKLLNIQNALKCNKGQHNDFGHYYYRSCEDILEAVKPLCYTNGCVLTITDEVALVGERFYVKAIATLVDIETGEKISNSALARESETKTGMDMAQITGAASSYARKYCLNGLFCIDDTKDADTNEYHNQTTERKINAKEVAEIQALAKRKGADINKALQYCKIDKITDLTIEQWAKLKKQLEGRADV